MKHSRRGFVKAAVGGLAVGALYPGSATRCQAAESDAAGQIVESVRNLGAQFLKNRVDVTGADGATSTMLPSGESLWVFGDTIEGPFETIHNLELTKFRSNTAALVPKQDVSQGIQRFSFLADADGKRPRQLVPFAPDEDPSVHRVWAIHGLCVGKNIYLYYHRISLLKGVDVFVNFQLDGMGIAKADASKLEFERLVAPDGTPEFWKPNEPTFGVFVTREDDYAYVWGSLMTGMYLARTRPESIADLASYEYLAQAPTVQKPDIAPRWSKKFEPTAVLFDSVPNEMSASYNRHLRKFVAFHSLHRENKIIMRTAPAITGPWSEGAVVYQPELAKEGYYIYAVKEHPELARENGRVLYLTFVNSETYIPQLIELTLK